MTTVPHGTDNWRKSSYSPNGSDCIEVAQSRRAVRDSKNPEAVLPGVDVRALVDAVRCGQLG